ncbi:PDC sensor domain-containing protein [Pseudonocardia spinosispora]|uniref:PDC sensor domain-containing protein n=1 Tax=Pseudonocardia spinosispora TaxID=103441 RepID=UPI000490C950|nr:PDC sensor domain-containing protein [Pseudonocardia spinosispora]
MLVVGFLVAYAALEESGVYSPGPCCRLWSTAGRLLRLPAPFALLEMPTEYIARELTERLLSVTLTQDRLAAYIAQIHRGDRFEPVATGLWLADPDGELIATAHRPPGTNILLWNSTQTGEHLWPRHEDPRPTARAAPRSGRPS